MLPQGFSVGIKLTLDSILGSWVWRSPRPPLEISKSERGHDRSATCVKRHPLLPPDQFSMSADRSLKFAEGPTVKEASALMPLRSMRLLVF